MTNANHTPGPWWQNEDESDTEQRANAALIQHAPDLLEAAEWVSAEGKINIAFEPWKSLAEAVKKARGE